MRLIDADDLEANVAKAFCKGCNSYKHIMCNACDVRSVMDEVDLLPTINPEDLRPKGKWVMRGGRRYCSHCKERACVTRDMEDFWYCEPTNYCPNCGAKMET